MDKEGSSSSDGSCWRVLPNEISSQEDYSHALFEGSWMITDHYLLVQKWQPLFIPQESEKVEKSIGTMLKVDEYTSIHSRGKFARICMKIDLRKKLVPSFSALGKEFRLEYEGLHLICFNCGRYIHKYDGCSEKMKETKDKQQSQVATEEQNHRKGETPPQSKTSQH
ncbi:hypothetical protein Ahy_A03g014148 [Arachis hypogaea]|uniref:DUF4283 domain-containing protein n=1 Tax=Arachis hypogaea TaxID=3818 RepID=A0A445DX28_ARAHY|nr:hypothetical protein Ahy_A03g014148 [Arachis hypogaea]